MSLTDRQFKQELAKIKEKNRQIEMQNALKKERNKYKKWSINTSTKILIASILSVVSFTIACLWIQKETGLEVSSTLIERWYTFWTVEIVSLAGIKVTKVIRNYVSHQDPDIEYEDILDECISEEEDA